MKLFLALIASIAIFGCSKNKCVSCIALSESKEILEHSIVCDQSGSYIKGVRDGIVQRYKDKDKNVEVTCKFN